MTPEQHLSRFLTVYTAASRDLESGNDASSHLPKIKETLLALDELISEVKNLGGRTQGYAALKQELVNVQEKIKQHVPVEV